MAYNAKGTWSLNLKTGELFWDERTKEIHEVPSDFVPKLSEAISFYREDYRQAVEEFVHKLINLKISYEIVCCLVTAKGKQIWVKSNGFPVEFENNKVVRIAGSFYDCSSELNDLNIHSAQSEILSGTSAISHTDSFGKIIYVNDIFCRLSGYSYQELIGNDHRIVNSGIHPSSFFENMWETIRHGKIWHGEIANKSKDGSIFWLDTYIYPMTDLNGHIYQYVSVRFDITEKKMREEQEKQFFGLVTIGENAASILHEVMNPLSIVSAKLELMKFELKKDNEYNHVLKHVEGMEKGIQRMTQIFQDMRNMIHGNMELRQVKLNDVIEKVKAFALMKLYKFKVQLIIKGDTEVEYFGNDGYLLQVLVNLINNSIDAINHLDDKWIEVQVIDSKDSEIVISVTDCGTGIPSEIAARIFEPLFTTKKQRGGTGLGLSLSKRLIQSMEGNIIYNTSSPHTRFDIFLKKYPDNIRFKSTG